MIIRSLRAEAFMRYELLELVDLPRGVIAITGENEAGKSTIGEAIAFALFGRSVRTETTDPAQAIHWEHDDCRTSIEVEVPGSGVYRVDRRVGRRGEFEATLYGPGDNILAEGPREVGEELSRLLGFDFPIFRYSFYVAQHELDLIQRESQDNARRIVSDMLGISTIERASSHLESERDEMRERGLTLDRDLAVAKALYTEMLPIREELQQIAARVERADAAFGEAQSAEQEAREHARLSRLAAEAGAERVDALGRLGVALFASVHRRHLLDAHQRLTALGAGLKGLSGGAKADAVEQARTVSQSAGTLSALVEARAAQLERELDASSGPDAIPTRIAAEDETITAAGSSLTKRTALCVLVLLLSLAAGGAGAATKLPVGKPALTFAERLIQSPRLGVAWTVTPDKATLPLAALGGVFFLGFLVTLVARGKARDRRAAGTSERGRLEELRRAAERERDACAKFQLGALSQVAPALEGVEDSAVVHALETLQAAAGELMSSASSPNQLLEEAGTRGRAARLGEQVSRALHELKTSLEALFTDGLPKPAGEQAKLPGDLDAYDAEIEAVTSRATKARVELEALSADEAPPAVEDAVTQAQAAFKRAFQAFGAEEAAKRTHYTEHTGLSELLKPRGQAPSIDDMRAVLQRERELGRESFGTLSALSEAKREAEQRLDTNRARLAEARAESEDAHARSVSLAVSQRRLEELEARIGDLSEVLDPMQRQVRVHDEAIDLLQDLAQALRSRFGPGIQRYVELVLPRLTQGRYRRTEVGDDLDIRIFSSERGDFVRLIDLSLGTADQVLLALRLGLARALIGSRGISGGHFLFLDEPLVSADESREQAFLDLLRTFDDEFSQIFVSSPRELSSNLFARRIHLRRENKTHRLEAEAPA